MVSEAKFHESLAELFGVDHAAEILVEDVEGLFDLDYLLAGDGGFDVLVGVEFGWGLLLFVFLHLNVMR